MAIHVPIPVARVRATSIDSASAVATSNYNFTNAGQGVKTGRVWVNIGTATTARWNVYASAGTAVATGALNSGVSLTANQWYSFVVPLRTEDYYNISFGATTTINYLDWDVVDGGLI